MVLSSSNTEPGQPCVMISGRALGCRERTWMKWMSTPSIVGHELRQGVQLRLGLAPVVAGAPILDERLELRELDALRLVVDRLPVGPARRRDAAAEVDQLLFRNAGLERSNRCVLAHRAGRSGLRGRGHRRPADGEHDC